MDFTNFYERLLFWRKGTEDFGVFRDASFWSLRTSAARRKEREKGKEENDSHLLKIKQCFLRVQPVLKSFSLCLGNLYLGIGAKRSLLSAPAQLSPNW